MKPILLVEDSEDDIFLMKLACERSGIPHDLHVARDGEEAVAYLSGRGEFADRRKHPLPHLVFLDVKMPKMDGHQVLEWIRSQPHYADLPVIMLTTSKSRTDVDRAYSLGVNSYLRKGEDMNEFGQGMRVILKYWLDMHTRAV